MAAARRVAWRAFADARVRTISFALLFALARSSRPPPTARATRRSRTGAISLAASATTDVARLLYGAPHDLITVGGYVSWRVGGTLAVFAARLGCSARCARCARRRTQGGLSWCSPAPSAAARRSSPSSRAIGVGAAVLWLALFVGFLAGRLPAGGSAYLALAIVSVVPVFAGVGAIASQLAPNKRMATGLATAVLVIAFALRTIAATVRRRRLAALGDTAGLGRGAAAVR